MKCIRSHTSDPFFNLAAEEYLLKNSGEDFYFQYVNDPTVVVGKHQNALAEVNPDFLSRNNIQLARRISGGGAVYHDHGNLNYSFITTEVPGDFIQFKKYAGMIIDALDILGVRAHLGKRNQIRAGKKKISGTASHVYKTRVLHHGTLLFDTDLELLANCLYADNAQFSDKAVRSVRSEVVNIKHLQQEKNDMEEFALFLFSYFLNLHLTNRIWNFSEIDIAAIGKLREEKFKQWEWNYGYSPKFQVERKSFTEAGEEIVFRTLVVKGVIEEVVVEGFPGPALQKVVPQLRGVRHDKRKVENKLAEISLNPGERELILNGIF